LMVTYVVYAVHLLRAVLTIHSSDQPSPNERRVCLMGSPWSSAYSQPGRVERSGRATAAFLNCVPRSCAIASKKTVERRRTPVAAIAA
jgi:hypothetical protein